MVSGPAFSSWDRFPQRTTVSSLCSCLLPLVGCSGGFGCHVGAVATPDNRLITRKWPVSEGKRGLTQHSSFRGRAAMNSSDRGFLDGSGILPGWVSRPPVNKDHKKGTRNQEIDRPGATCGQMKWEIIGLGACGLPMRSSLRGRDTDFLEKQLAQFTNLTLVGEHGLGLRRSCKGPSASLPSHTVPGYYIRRPGEEKWHLFNPHAVTNWKEKATGAV